MKRLLILILLFSLSAFVHSNEANPSWAPQLTMTGPNTQPKRRVYDTQGGKCRVWVTETLQPRTPIIGERSVIYPYNCHRPNHKYNCVDRNYRGHNTTSAVDASYQNKISFDYEIINGLPKFTNYQNPGNNEETSCGELIIEHLKSISLQ